MAISLRYTIRLSSSIFMKNVCIETRSSNKRFIMTSRSKLDKVLNDLQKNPYFDKYAEKIAKFQKTCPEEFLQRAENQEKKERKAKVAVHLTRSSVQSLWTFPFLKTKIQSSWSHINKNNFCDNAIKNTYITTPIFYVNAGPHIGHLYTAVLADAMARFNSMLGHSVFLNTGTDEHGTKVENAAKAAGMLTHEYCTEISLKFLEMCHMFGIKYSDFIRTTEKRHMNAVHHFWNCLEERGHIYLGRYSGWYSTLDETFVSDTELIEEKDKAGNIIQVSNESGNPVEWTEEDNYKFRLTSFKDDLKYWLKNENTVQPAIYRNTLLNWIEDLQDLSISRPISRVPWAIPTPNDNSHTIYVWFDALVNYLTGVNYPNRSFKQFWPPSIQVVGKDILKFHGIYWPAFLIGAGLEPPKKLLCHGHWTIDDLKMSKSRGNVISPFEAMTNYTPEGLRYFLLRQAVLHSNANYNAKKIQNLLNAELANNMGNLINRCLGKSINPNRTIPSPSTYIEVLKSKAAIENIKTLEVIGEKTRVFYEKCQLHNVVDTVMNMLHISNQMFNDHKPWYLRESSNFDSAKELEAVISLSLESVRVAATILYPIIPRVASTILDSFQMPRLDRSWNETTPLHITDALNRTNRTVLQNELLFKKIN
ncbi:methionine--tRNA ligase, mitochondrial-like isoform X1 [Hylaeus volcanicus]|uniref:methionine--tRNA ligase, mitochondrial-like isoform X1 n=2 Tax=Hylaeus volcanicus TaxID=313075 RepID=UPI0023B7BB1D|nr:methionine--tRNA ligase, mitochondrial-like isoform X1 [Hylaeus volcanicus]XP_053975925.1 methionine--tRNA ligase, mitochondrial-like isoform X1 [Hylaeus volcanicus]